MLNCRCYLITRVPEWNNRNSNRSLQFQCLRCFHSCDMEENTVDKKTTQFRFFILLYPILLLHAFTPFHTHEIPEPSLPLTIDQNYRNIDYYTTPFTIHILYLFPINIYWENLDFRLMGGGTKSFISFPTTIFIHLEPLDLIDTSIIAWIKVDCVICLQSFEHSILS